MIWLLLLFTIIQPSSQAATPINIGLYDTNTLYITANHSFVVKQADGQVMLANKPGDRVLLRSSPAAANKLVIASPPNLLTTSDNLSFECSDPQRLCLFKLKQSIDDSNIYNIFRGSININPSKTYFTVINKIDLEDYLRGVVPGEMPSSWGLEALKAQAVAARTYTLKNLGRRKDRGYDLNADVTDQMYLGYKKEDSRTNQAILETKGEVLLDNQGNLIDAYYSSHAGRFTNTAQAAWGLSFSSSLQAKPEYISSSRATVGAVAIQNYHWQQSFTLADLKKNLMDLKLDNNIIGINIINRSMAGRVDRVLISADNQVTLTGEEFRHHLKLKSTDFTISYTSEGISISGYGFGHGIGMSQYGSKSKSDSGKSYKEILQYYYDRANLAKLL